MFISALVVTLAIFVIFLYHDWSSYRYFRQTFLPESSLTETVGIIIHLDETLTMSARMAAATGSPQWEQRYRMYEPQLDAAILKAKQIAPGIFTSDAARQTELANIALVELENRSFELVRRGRLDEADALLSSSEYIVQKRAYAEGFRKIQVSLDKRKSEHLSNEYHNLILSLAFTCVFFPLQLFIWVSVYKLLQKYRTDRKLAEEERAEALTRVKKLEGIIPICMHCKKIRDDQNSWNQLEQYITNHSEAMFSHGICPQCYEEQMASIKNSKTSA